MSTDEQRVRQLDALHACLVELRATQIGAAEIGVDQAGTDEVGTTRRRAFGELPIGRQPQFVGVGAAHPRLREVGAG